MIFAWSELVGAAGVIAAIFTIGAVVMRHGTSEMRCVIGGGK